MSSFSIPDLRMMSDEEVRNWIETLTTPVVYAYLRPLTEAVMDRFGENARIATSTYQSPKIVYLIAETA